MARPRVSVRFQCAQRYADMAPRPDGARQCAHCDRGVHDFRGLTLDAIADAQARLGPVCGVYDRATLDAGLAAPSRASAVPVAAALALTTLALPVLDAAAQAPAPTEQRPPSPVPQTPSAPAADASAATDSVRVIAGRVVEAGSGEGIPGAAVWVDGTRLGAFTDLDGHFRLSLPAAEWSGRPVTLRARYLGYDTGTLADVLSQSVLFRLRESPLDTEIVTGAIVVRSAPRRRGW